jgi:quinol monooxygenase YgiN
MKEQMMDASVKKQAIRKIVRITSKPGRAIELHYALKALENETRKEPGCREFSFFRALSSDESFLLVEDFVDQDAFNQHQQLQHTREFFDKQLTASIQPLDFTGPH